jgi:hypothetical protein
LIVEFISLSYPDISIEVAHLSEWLIIAYQSCPIAFGRELLEGVLFRYCVARDCMPGETVSRRKY